MLRTSTAVRIRRQVSAIMEGLVCLINQLPILYFDRNGGSIVFITPEHYWGERTTEQRVAQIQLKRKYESIIELLNLLFRSAPKELVENLKDADQEFRVWLELESNWSISADRAKNEASLRAVVVKFEAILAVLDVAGGENIIIVPDTNSLLSQADPAAYRLIGGTDAFVFMLLPSVLGELDRLKVEHRNIEVREKAKNVIKRIKGWRQQGSLSGGVTVERSITVRAVPCEPDMKCTLSWLDANVQDDRIIASLIELQAEQTSARIILVTGDINLQNKADVALIETAEIPELTV